MAHTHKAQPGRAMHCAWMYCVTPRECAAKPVRQCAHGNITIIDFCFCGAIRYGERNQNCTNYGPWVEPEQK